MPVSPGKYNPMLPDIELFDYKSKKRYGLKLDGTGSLQVGTISQDDTVHIRTQGKKVGDFDEQRSWKGGRGVEDLSSNPSGYWDSQNAWTLSDGHVMPTLLWQFARGLRKSQFSMPNKDKSMAWTRLISSERYLSFSFVADQTFNADYARLWIRKHGTPGTLTVELCSNSSGDPGTVLVTATVTDVDDVISVLERFDWTGTQAISSGTTYHVKIYGASTDNKNNCWEVGGYAGGTTGKYSSDNSSWTATPFEIYYFIADADINRTFYPFFLDSAMYLVDSKDDFTASSLYINGDRGKVVTSNSTSFADTSKSWVASQWVGAWVKIIRGKGLGQTWQITASTGNNISISGNGVWALDSTSEYIIYSTPHFTEIGTTGLGRVVSKPLVHNQIVYFPQGATANIRKMIWNPATPGHSFSDEANKASYMTTSVDGSGVKVWIALNNSGSGSTTIVGWSSEVQWSTTPGAFTFTTKQIGDVSHVITNLVDFSGLVYVFKEDGVWNIMPSNFTLVKLSSGIEKVPTRMNGKAAIAHQQFLIYSWLHSVIRVYGSSHDDIGQDWSGWGLPDGREGVFGSMDSYTSLLICGVDAGTGTSSVLGFDGIGWHELLRAYDAGARIRMVKIQPCEGTRNRLWTEIGGDLVFQEMPYLKGSPRLDSGCRYMHEAVVESSALDMGTASGLSKFIKELTVYCENLGDDNEIRVDYQIDDDVHTSRWTEATALFESPESSAWLGLENIRKFAYRLRMFSRDNSTPVDVQGVVPNGYARVPYKMVWTMRCRADNITARGRLAKPDELMRWLLDNARHPGRIEMRSQYQLAHKFYVIIHPPRMFPYKPAQNGQSEESVFTIVLEEV